MYISKPINYFVPVIFGELETLDLLNTDLEIEEIRENTSNKIGLKESVELQQELVNKEGSIYIEIDDEYVEQSTKSINNVGTIEKQAKKGKATRDIKEDKLYRKIDNEYIDKDNKKRKKH